MGNQGHTFEGIRRIKEWYDAGIMGPVREIITWTNRPKSPWFIKPTSIPPKKDSIPASLDWDLWLGPSMKRAYSLEYAPKRWRGWWDFGCGSLGDIGCHTFDTPFWVLGLGSPSKVEVKMNEKASKDYIPWGSIVTYHFPKKGNRPAVVMKWHELGFDPKLPKELTDTDSKEAQGGGMILKGKKKHIYHYGMRAKTPRYSGDREDLRNIERMPKAPGGPIEELFAAIRGEIKETGSNFDYASPLTEVVLLGALAQRTGKTIEWDAEDMRVKGQPQLDMYIKEPVRKGWSYGENI